MQEDPPEFAYSFKKDPEFLEAWNKKGYLYSDSNIEKVYMGWLMATEIFRKIP